MREIMCVQFDLFIIYFLYDFQTLFIVLKVSASRNKHIITDQRDPNFFLLGQRIIEHQFLKVLKLESFD